VWGEQREPNVFHAVRMQVKVEGKPPDDVAAVGRVLDQAGRTVVLEAIGGAHKYTILTDEQTEFVFPAGEAQPRPERVPG